MANTKTVFEQIKALTEKELAIFISDLIKTEDKPHGCKCPAGSFQYDPATKETRNKGCCHYAKDGCDESILRWLLSGQELNIGFDRAAYLDKIIEQGDPGQCKHCLGTGVNEIGEWTAFCEEYEHRNITLGECFGNCEAQEMP